MNRKTTLSFVAAIVVAGAASYDLYLFGMQRGMGMAGGAVTTPASGVNSGPQSIAQGEAATKRHIATGIKTGDIDPETGKKILYHHDPVVPGNKFDKPAKSPFMDMMLVPVCNEGDSDQSNVPSARAFSRTSVYARLRWWKACSHPKCPPWAPSPTTSAIR